MKKKSLLTMLLALAMVCTMLTGCGGEASVPADSAPASVSVETPAAPEQPAVSVTEEIVSAAEEPTVEPKLPENYPMIAEDGMTVTAFQSTNPMMTDLMTDFNDLPWWQEVTARTGIGFDWTMASYASVEEQFNLLCAASDLPSFVCTANYYTDGIASAVENNIFVDLADYLDAYAPDYKAITMQDGIRQSVYDENGSITDFYQIGMEEFVPNNGVIFRKDMLEEQDLMVPQTYDQYEEVLLALKDAYDLEAPIFHYTGNELWLSAGKGVKKGFSLNEEGRCIYGPVEDGYREYLKIANKWYKEGLIFHDYYVIPSGQNISYMIEYMSAGKSAATFGYCEFAGMIALEEGQGFAAGYVPRDQEGEQVHLTEGVDKKLATGVCYAISCNATEEEIQNLCMMMNYFYTEEGALLANYGIEGQSFEYRDDGTPWYTDLVVNNPDGLTQTQALLFYVGYMVPSYADYTKYNISSLTTWADFIDAWGTADNANDMPQVNLTIQETEKYAAVASDVDTYLDEALVKFVIGDMNVNDDAVWNEYLAKMDSLGVGTMVDIYTAALERYNNA